MENIIVAVCYHYRRVGLIGNPKWAFLTGFILPGDSELEFDAEFATAGVSVIGKAMMKWYSYFLFRLRYKV